MHRADPAPRVGGRNAPRRLQTVPSNADRETGIALAGIHPNVRGLSLRRGDFSCRYDHPGHGVDPHKVIFDGLDPGNTFRGHADRPALPLIEQRARRCTTPLRTTTLMRPTGA